MARVERGVRRESAAPALGVVVAVVVAVVASAAGVVPAFGEEPYQPVRVVVAVKGLENAEAQIAVTGELYKLDAVEEAAVVADKITLAVKPEATLVFGDVEKAVRAGAAAAGVEAQPELDFGALALVGACRLTLALAGSAADAAVAKALRAAPRVTEVKGAGLEWTVTFAGPQGATVAEVAAALAAELGRTPNAPPPGVADVAWTAPKAPPKKGGHGCGAGGCGGGKGGEK